MTYIILVLLSMLVASTIWIIFFIVNQAKLNTEITLFTLNASLLFKNLNERISILEKEIEKNQVNYFSKN